jgi:hypothetical protein
VLPSVAALTTGYKGALPQGASDESLLGGIISEYDNIQNMANISQRGRVNPNISAKLHSGHFVHGLCLQYRRQCFALRICKGTRENLCAGTEGAACRDPGLGPVGVSGQAPE